MSAGPVELHIRELVLEGVAPGDRARVVAAMERELGRLLEARRGQLPAVVSRPAIEARPIAARPGTPPRELGRQIARSVVGGLLR